MRTKVVLKKGVIWKLSICLIIYSTLFFILFLPRFEKDDFVATLLMGISFLVGWSMGLTMLGFMIWKFLCSASCEIDENGVAFVPVNKSLKSSMDGFFPWNENIRITTMPFFGLQFVSKRGHDFLNYPYIAALPFRSGIENTAEIDEILENVPSSRLSDLFRSPCHKKLT